MVPRGLVQRMLGLEDRVGHQLTRVLVGQPVEDARAILASGHQAPEAHFREMLRDGGGGLLDHFGELIHALFSFAEGEHESHARGICEHRENFYRKLDVLAVGQPSTHRSICIHA